MRYGGARARYGGVRVGSLYGRVRVGVAGGVPSCRRDAVNESSAVTLHNTCTRTI